MKSYYKLLILLLVSALLGTETLLADIVPQTDDPTNSDTYYGWVDNTNGELADATITGTAYSGSGASLPNTRFIYLNEANFPDPNFRSYVGCFPSVYPNGSIANTVGYITQSVTDIMQSIDINYAYGISSLEGIQFFTGLISISISNNQITQFDYAFNSLRDLYLSNLQLESFNPANFPNLQSLNLVGIPVSEMDLRQNNNLVTISLEDNRLTSINIENLTRLKNLFINNNQLTNIDLTTNTALNDLRLSNNLLSTINLNNNTQLSRILVNGNQLTSFDLDDTHTMISEINVSDNQISEFTNIPSSVRWLYAANNLLSEINIQNLSNLATLDIAGNQFRFLDVSDREKLSALFVQDNLLSSLIIGSNLGSLYAQNNQLETLDLSSATKLTYINISNNRLGSIQLNSSNLRYIYLSGNQLTSLNLEGISNITDLWADNNLLTELKVDANSTLTNVNVANNRLENLDLSIFNRTTRLDISKNGIKSFDPSTLTRLKYLNLNSNELSTLDVSGNKALRTLKCSDNKLTSLTLPNACEVESGSVYYVSSTTYSPYPSYYSVQAGISFDNRPNYSTYEGEYVKDIDYKGLLELHCANNQLTSLDMRGEKSIGVVCSDYADIGFIHWHDISNGDQLPSQYSYDASLFDPTNNGRHLPNVEKAFVGIVGGKEKYIYYLRLDEPQQDEQHINVRIGDNFDLSKVTDWKSGGEVIDGKRNKLSSALAKRGIKKAGIDDSTVFGKILLLDETNPRIVYSYNTEGGHKNAYMYSVWDHINGESEQYELLYTPSGDFIESLVAPFSFGRSGDPTSSVDFYLTWDPVENEVVTGIVKIENNDRTPQKINYINSLGMVSDKPFKGVNIVVTQHSDGTTTTNKIVHN